MRTPAYLLSYLVVSTVCAIASESTSPGPFVERIAPFLRTHCDSCHSGDSAEGGLQLDQFVERAEVQQHYDLWEKVRRLIRDQQMPPADEPQPTAEEASQVVSAIEFELSRFECRSEPHPGNVTIRRLNRAEYNNSIRDLVGLDLQPANDFPADDVGIGFDNIGDVLTIPPVLMEKYLNAAETVAQRVYADEAARARVFPHQPANDEERVAVARRNAREFATRAFRRPIQSDEEDRLFRIMLAAWSQDGSEAEIVQTVVAAILASPHFLFRIETPPAADDEDGIRDLNDFELSTRLSYFLWSSIPDERLNELAARGALKNQETLIAETRRMLADPKSRALVDNFAGQWLQLRDIARLAPDPNKFPSFDEELRAAMRRETELFFETMIREDRSVLDLLDADYTFVNERLARHYGIDGITGSDFRQVPIAANRRGVLTHAGVLMLTSNPTRTSPVKRGKWILENILLEPPPPPPPNVPLLEEGAETLGSLRERMEQHRSNPSCAVCHRTMDALGFALEQFDAVGARRERDGQYEIDPSGELPGGRAFRGGDELMRILSTEKREEFCRCLTTKLLIYALGRGLRSYDRCVIKEALESLQKNEYRFSALVISIVTSDPFLRIERTSEP